MRMKSIEKFSAKLKFHQSSLESFMVDSIRCFLKISHFCTVWYFSIINSVTCNMFLSIELRYVEHINNDSFCHCWTEQLVSQKAICPSVVKIIICLSIQYNLNVNIPLTKDKSLIRSRIVSEKWVAITLINSTISSLLFCFIVIGFYSASLGHFFSLRVDLVARCTISMHAN